MNHNRYLLFFLLVFISSCNSSIVKIEQDEQASQNVFSECAGNGINFYPIGKRIKQNSIIMIDSYAESQHIINGLNIKYSIYLKSKSHIVPLDVVEVLKGDFRMTQAILILDRNV